MGKANRKKSKERGKITMETFLKKEQINIEFSIESETSKGAYYEVTFTNKELWKCTCMSFQNRGGDCKHIKVAKKLYADRIQHLND